MSRPARVLYVCRKFPQTSETFVVDEIAALERAGFAVDILADKILARGFRRFPGLAPGRFVGLPAWAGENPRGPFLAVASFLANRLPPATRLRLFRRRAEYAALVAHFGPAVLGAAALKRRLGMQSRLAGIFHGYDMSRAGAGESLGSFRDWLAEIDVFMPISALWGRRLEEAGIPPERIVVSRLGIDARAVAALAGGDPPRQPSRPFRLVSVGRLVEKKGFDVLLAALGRLGPAFVRENFRLEIIGEGRRRRALVDQAGRLGLAGFVVLSGGHDRAEVLRRIRRADLFVLASRTAADGDMEGLPVVLMEAMALRVPVVSTVHSGIPELVEDGRTGRLVPEGDEKALTEVLADFAANPEAFRRLVDPAHRRLLEDFSAEQHVNDLIAAIDPATRHRPGLSTELA